MFGEFRVVASHISAGYAFEAVNQAADGCGRVEVDEQVYMIRFTVEFFQSAAEIFAHISEDGLQMVEMFGSKHFMPVFCDENQMHMHVKDAVSSLANVVLSVHETNYNSHCWKEGTVSQKTIIEQVRVEGEPFLGYDRCGAPIRTNNPNIVMRWLCFGWRFRFNQLRSRRMKYASPDHKLLEYIGGAPDMRKTSETREDYPWLACIPDNILDSTLKCERTEWSAAIKRRKTLREKGLNPGAMPRFKRKSQDLTFVCWHRKGRNAIFRQLNRRHGEVTITGMIPTIHRIPGQRARYRIIIRVRLSQHIREYTSIRVNWTRLTLVFTNSPLPIERKKTGACVGLDGGAVHEVTDSNGIFHDLPISQLKHIDRRVRKLQRKQARLRMKAGLQNTKDYLAKGASAQYQKLDKRINELYAKATRVTIDTQHRISTQLVKNNDLIVVEALQVENMTHKPKPKPDLLHPSRFLPNGRAAKRGLNRVMKRASLGRLYDMLEYKAKLANVAYITINPAYTSQTCNRCGYVYRGNRKNQANFLCQRCGYRANADVNAAINILNRGLETTWGGTRPSAEGRNTLNGTKLPLKEATSETQTNRL